MEETNKVQRSEMWEQIYIIVKQIPRKEVECDSMDAPIAATQIEEYFLKTCNKPAVSGSLPTNMNIWKKARSMNYVEFCKWFNPRKGNDR